MSASTLPVMTSDARRLLRHPPFVRFLLGRGFSTFAAQIGTVAIGWQIYALTSSAFDLGMVGLAQFIPVAGLTFFAGHVADRYSRKRVVQICQSIEAAVALVLALGSFQGWVTAGEIFGAVSVLGAARAFESPSISALLPGVVPEGLLQKGTAISSGAFQLAVITGPSLGGVLYALSPGAPYALMMICWAASSLLNAGIALDRPVSAKAPPDLGSLFAGVAFVRATPTILGIISLDLFAVLLGGATALLPIYARDILHTGPWGLGLLRGAPAIGALLITLVLARHAISRRVGMRMFQAVIMFGLATIVFALSSSLWLTIAALAVMGAADTVSVVIRVSLVQLATPDDMRGRVGAVNFLFINASNQLGEFESGMTAALFGAIPAAALGGIGTVLIALLWMRLFPALKEVERLE